MLLCFDWSSIQAGLESIRARSISSFFKHLRPSCQKLTMHRQLPGLHCERLCHRPVSLGDTRNSKIIYIVKVGSFFCYQIVCKIIMVFASFTRDCQTIFLISATAGINPCVTSFVPSLDSKPERGYFLQMISILTPPPSVSFCSYPPFPRLVLSYNSDYTTRCCIFLGFDL